ncbi:hypothetical protein XA68_10046 [Ophiocordyceps unilateralis]|uniref:SprT-like domain-containing protein n=1 Tax=Ophiocordyceps unilateralis TaxID=268505 RepID=A0A2A9PVI7_OPHUN|nr:hypothetical protein XA68_10046 [Ophiocordyceps unilateralis]
MAFWVLGGGASSLHDDGARCFEGGKRKMAGSFAHGLSHGPSHGLADEDAAALHGYYTQKRARMTPWGAITASTTADGLCRRGPSTDSIRNLAFLVIREGDTPASSSPSPSPEPLVSPVPSPCPRGRNEPPPGFAHGLGSASAPPCAMERTESGLSISSTTSPRDALSSLALDDNDDIATGRVLSDLEAAHLVHAHLTAFRRRCPDSQSERILRALITPKSRAADFPLDNDALRSIFSASNELFFASRLACRVAWDWSHPTCGQYESHIVGTTALRRCARLGGWETLIVLSSPILRDTKYNRRLLISTFLHEMIHSFMFVTCGLKASHDGGHTEGFQKIAAIIDDWAGKDYLRLTDMEADLERFRGDDAFSPGPHHQPHFPCFARPDDGGGSDDDHCQGESRLGPDYNHPAMLGFRDRPHAQDGSRHHHNHYSHDAAALPAITYSHHGPIAVAAAQDGWKWCEQENFGPHSPYPSGSPYVY